MIAHLFAVLILLTVSGNDRIRSQEKTYLKVAIDFVSEANMMLHINSSKNLMSPIKTTVYKNQVCIVKRYAGKCRGTLPNGEAIEPDGKWGNMEYGNNSKIIGFSSAIDSATGDVYHFIAVENSKKETN